MKLEFERPLAPNFIKTKQGRFDIKVLSKEDLEDYKIEFCNAIEDNWRRRKHSSSSENTSEVEDEN